MIALSVVVPIYNEQEVLPEFFDRLLPVLHDLDVPFEIVAVDDGSTDQSAVVLQSWRRRCDHLRVLRLRANAGHQAALSAGLIAARGAHVVTIDADLQDPPEVITQMYRTVVAQDVDVVYAVRSDRSTDSWFKRTTASLFYQVIARVVDRSGPQQAGDFRLMSRATVDAVNALPPRGRVLRLVVPGFGFPSAIVHFERQVRAAGVTKYPLSKMLRLSLDAVTGYSVAPLRLATWLGLAGGFAALAIMLYALGSRVFGHTVPGWTSTVTVMAAVAGVQLLCLGILGEYVGKIFEATRGTATYHVAYDSLTADESSDC